MFLKLLATMLPNVHLAAAHMSCRIRNLRQNYPHRLTYYLSSLHGYMREYRMSDSLNINHKKVEGVKKKNSVAMKKV